MGGRKKIIGLGVVNELWEASFRESGFDYLNLESSSELSKSSPDFLVFDARTPNFQNELKQLRQEVSSPILSLVSDSISRSDLAALKNCGSTGSINFKTPPEEVIWRVKAMLRAQEAETPTTESRSADRVWFQEQVKFEIFDRAHIAWSTTLSETGIFLRTSLSFPLYSTVKLSFPLWGEPEHFSCDGVIVRQETDSDLKGLGIMFQNLTGESIRRLESFFESYS